MLIGFIGCPSSGKTTTAAMTFADLKDMGISAEFIPEQARLYIAEKRLVLNQEPGSVVKLMNQDQMEILLRQRDLEQTLVKSSGPDTIVITDSCILNTVAYLDEITKPVLDLVGDYLPNYDLLFYCGPVKPGLGLDVNRIHNEIQSLKIDEILRALVEGYQMTCINLLGDSRRRHHEVTQNILEKLVR